MNVLDFGKKKQLQQKISMLTCYDYPSACTIAQSSVDCVLVGDSVAMAVHGYATTIMATMDMMIMHTQAVAKGLNQQFLITDLPFLGHKSSQADTIKNARALLQAGAHALKIEGCDADTCATIAYLTAAGIPVMGHLGLTPQFFHQLGGFKVQGRSKQQAEQLLHAALKLEQAGCFAVVIECIPYQVAHNITCALTIPTIGIGAGMHTDGQVLVWHDVLGLSPLFQPKFLKQYAQGSALFLHAIDEYVAQVKNHEFPTLAHSFAGEC